MGVITYTAVDRGKLAPGHSAGTQYQIETAFQGFPLDMLAKGQVDETLDGTPEGWLDALQDQYDITTDLVDLAAVPGWREFFSSVFNGETFQIAFSGTIADPGQDIDVWMVSRRIREQQVRGVAVQYQFSVKRRP